ncbi:MAG: hypothetical protein K6C32_00080, partial [Bacilli bacterium]|nr:hypothetical protein [Bacilli bacterium]
TWGNSVGLIFQEPSAVVYGYGFGIFRYIVRNTGSLVFSAHNNVLEIFGSYGLIGVTLFLSVMVYFLIILIKILKKRYFRFGFAYLAFATTILLCGIMESFGFFVGNTIGVLETFLILLPPLFFYQRLKNDELDKEILSFKTFKERPQEDRYLGAIAYSLVAIFTMVLSALIIYCVNFNADVVMYLSFALAVVVIFAFTKLYFFSNRLIKKRKFNVPIYMLLIPLDEIALSTSLLALLNHFTHNKVLGVIAASTLYLVMSIVTLVIFIKKGNKKFKSIFSEQMEYLFKDHWIKKLVLFILSIALSLVLAFTIHPDALQTIAIAIMVGVTFLCIYYMFSKKNDDYVIVTISDEIIAKHQKMIKEEKLYGQK